MLLRKERTREITVMEYKVIDIVNPTWWYFWDPRRVIVKEKDTGKRDCFVDTEHILWDIIEKED